MKLFLGDRAFLKAKALLRVSVFFKASVLLKINALLKLRVLLGICAVGLLFPSLVYAQHLVSGSTVTHSKPQNSQLTIVPVYQYHNWAPFYFQSGENHAGFALTFMEQLNQFFTKNYPELNVQFELHPVTRAELNALLKERQQGMVLWANELWFKRLFNEPYFSATQPIYWDNEAVVSLTKSPVEYSTPESLISKKVAGIEGFYYHGVDQLVSQGKIERINTNSDRINLEKLVDGKVDAVLITQTVFNYVLPGFADIDFYQASTPQDAYSRHILITPLYADYEPVLNAYIASLPSNLVWANALSSYGLDDLVLPFSLDLNELNNFSIE